jgi:phytoene desaturase
MFGIISKLHRICEEAGVKFHFSNPVKEIIISEKKASGIITENGENVSADIVVANADLPYVYRSLLKDGKMSRRLERLEYSCSAICLHWGLDKQYPRLDHHNVFLSDGFREGLDSIFRDKTMGARPSFYVHAPVRTDPEAAPPEGDTLSFIIASGHIDKSKKQDWAEIKRKARDYVVERLKKAGLDDIDNHIKFEIVYTPESWVNACNISRGSVFGSLGHNILQMGWFRPHNRHDNIPNLYFVGGSTHPGNGMPNVLMSAKLVCERIISGK